MKPLDEMLSYVKNGGKLSAAEISFVAAELQHPQGRSDAYTLIHILGRSEAKQYVSLVERFLDDTSDPMVVCMALRTLCDYWGLFASYSERVAHFIGGDPSDVDEEIRGCAISAAGEFLRRHDQPEILHNLLAIFENTSESQSIREAAYFALARASGAEWSQLPSAAKHFDLTSVPSEVIADARRRLASVG